MAIERHCQGGVSPYLYLQFSPHESKALTPKSILTDTVFSLLIFGKITVEPPSLAEFKLAIVGEHRWAPPFATVLPPLRLCKLEGPGSHCTPPEPQQSLAHALPLCRSPPEAHYVVAVAGNSHAHGLYRSCSKLPASSLMKTHHRRRGKPSPASHPSVVGRCRVLPLEDRSGAELRSTATVHSLPLLVVIRGQRRLQDKLMDRASLLLSLSRDKHRRHLDFRQSSHNNSKMWK